MQTVFKNEKEFDEFKSWTYGILRDKNVKNLCVVFTKKDGSQREMHCTLAEGRIPEDKQPKQKEEATSQTAGSAVRVFDLDLQEWRSFRWDSVIKVSFDL